MEVATRSRRPLLAGGEGRPAIIAHGSGNTAALALAGREALADYLEVDLWVHNGALEARHERRLPFRMPFLYEAWYLRLARLKGHRLRELIEDAGPATGLFLDLKSGGERAGELIAEALDGGAPPAMFAASAQHWPILRGLARHVPGAALYYSIDVRAQLDLLLSLHDRDTAPTGISCRHTLLTRSIVREMHEGGLNVVAWTVDEPGRAEELAGWGVDGITTHRVADIRDRLGLS